MSKQSLGSHAAALCLLLFLDYSSCQQSLTRTTDRECGDIACPGQSIQYRCILPHRGTVVWHVPGCREDLTINAFLDDNLEDSSVCNEGMEINAQVEMEENVYVSYLNITNIIGELTVECMIDGNPPELIGNHMIVMNGSAPDIIQNVTSDSDLVFTWDVKYEQCPSVQYDVSNSTNCGTCLNISANKVICTNGKAGEQCTFKLSVVVCGVVVNQRESTVFFASTSTKSSTISPPISITNGAGSLSNGAIGGIVFSGIIFFVVILAAVVLLLWLVFKCASGGKTNKEKYIPASKNSQNVEMLMVEGPGPTQSSASPSANEAAPGSSPTSTTKLLPLQKSSHHTKDMKPSKLFISASVEQASPQDPIHAQSTTVELSTEVLTADESEVPPTESADHVNHINVPASNNNRSSEPTYTQSTIAELSTEVLTTDNSEVPPCESTDGVDYNISSATAQGPSEVKQNPVILKKSNEFSKSTAASGSFLSSPDFEPNSMRNETSLAGTVNSNFDVGQSADVEQLSTPQNVGREDSVQVDGDKFPNSVEENDNIANGISGPNSKRHSCSNAHGDVNSADAPRSHTVSKIAHPESDVIPPPAAIVYSPAIRTGAYATSLQRSSEVGLFRADLGDSSDYHPSQKESTPLEKTSKLHVDEETIAASSIHERLNKIIDGQEQLQKQFMDGHLELKTKIINLENLIEEKDKKISDLEIRIANLEKEKKESLEMLRKQLDKENKESLEMLKKQLDKEKQEREDMQRNYEGQLSLLREENERLKSKETGE